MSYAFQRGGVWYIGYRNALGIAVREATSAPTKGKAKRLAADKEAKAERIANGEELATVESHTWAEASQRYLDDVVPTLRSQGPARSYLKHYVSKAFKGKLIREITRGEAEAWVKGHRHLSPGSQEQIRVRSMAVYTLAERLQWATEGRNPFKKWNVKQGKTRPKWLTEEEVRAVIRAAQPRDRNLFAVAMLCGLRKGELAGLHWEDVDLANLCIHVRHSYDGPTKSGNERDVSIPPECVLFLMDQKRKATGPLVFPAPRGQMYGPSWSASRDFKLALQAAGVARTDVTFRSMRSTFGTHFAKQTGDLSSTQDALGHSNPQITKAHYAAAIPEHRARQARRFSYGLTPAELPSLQRREQRCA